MFSYFPVPALARLLLSRTAYLGSVLILLLTLLATQRLIPDFRLFLALPTHHAMWRRLYLFLLLVRVYFALSPSYIHPDEHFQGLEVIAGTVFQASPRRSAITLLPHHTPLADPSLVDNLSAQVIFLVGRLQGHGNSVLRIPFAASFHCGLHMACPCSFCISSQVIIRLARS